MFTVVFIFPPLVVIIERANLKTRLVSLGFVSRSACASYVEGGGLMSAATRFVELLATTFGEQRYTHRASMVEDVSRKDA